METFSEISASSDFCCGFCGGILLTLQSSSLLLILSDNERKYFERYGGGLSLADDRKDIDLCGILEPSGLGDKIR